MPPLDFLMSAPSPVVSRAPKRTRGPDANTAQVPLERQVQELRSQLQKVCQLVSSHGQSLRELDDWSTHTWVLDKDSELAKTLVEHMEQWKKQLPPRGQPHPYGPARHMVAGGLAQWLLKTEDRRQAMPAFVLMHEQMTAHSDLAKSVQLTYIKPIRDGRILLKLRPQQVAQKEWAEAIAWLDQSLASLHAEKKHLAPPGPLVRAISGKAKPTEIAED